MVDSTAEQDSWGYREFLLRAGEPKVTGTVQRYVLLPPSVKVVGTTDHLINIVYWDFAEMYGNVSWMRSRATITIKDRTLQHINDKVGEMIPRHYLNILTADLVLREDENSLQYPVELLYTIKAVGMLPDLKLSLKKGFVVIFLPNVSTRNKHCNGTNM